MSYWGKYADDEKPTVYFDPLASFNTEKGVIGYRIHVVASRGQRPREHPLPSAKIKRVKNYSQEYKEKSVLYRIVQGKESAIFVTGDTEVLGNPDDQPLKRNMMDYAAVSIVNKFSPLDILGDEAGGAALVIFPTHYTEDLSHPAVITNILQACSTAITHLLGVDSYRDDLRTPMTFFNIGPASGASLKLLHAQTYITPYAAGLLTYTFNEAFNASTTCTTCKLARDEYVIDHLGQHLDIKSLTLWEDDFVRLHVPVAAIRPLALRILIKRHLKHLGELSIQELESLGQALSHGHNIILNGSPPTFPVKRDRTVAFRQTRDREEDFHLFVDILPTIPLGGAEVIDSLSVTQIDPYRMAERMRSVFYEMIEGSD